MKVVVTGATGHLGRAVVQALAARAHEVTAFGSQDLPLEDEQSVASLAAAIGAGASLVHLAAWHPPATAATGASERRRLLEVNVMGTMRALEAAGIARAAAVVYASSFEVYGAPVIDPIDEAHPTRPLTDYGATKLAGEDHALAFAHEKSTRVVALRMPAIYGPGEHTPRALPNFLRAVARGEAPAVQGDGEDQRDLLFVDDAAQAVVLAVEGTARGIFNVSDGRRHSIGEIARVAMAVGRLPGAPRFEPRVKPRLDYHMSIERARAQLGFEPKVDLERGMAFQLAGLRAAAKS